MSGPTARSSIEKAAMHEGDFPGSFPETIAGLVPPELERASRRLEFPPSYVVVGIYRLVTDRSLSRPAWDKCKHGTQRGLMVGFVWVGEFSSIARSSYDYRSLQK